MDIALGLRVRYSHPAPLVSFLSFEGHDVAKILPVVVLRLYWLMTETSNSYFNVVNALFNAPIKLMCPQGETHNPAREHHPITHAIYREGLFHQSNYV